jgi:alpha-galactosidase
MVRRTAFLLTLACLVGATSGVALGDFKPQPLTANGLAPTPPMGWNSWNRFGCDISETTIHSEADALVSSGMRDAGYVYVVVDDCWHGARDAAGNIHAEAGRFPSGIKALADYVHGKGLKFGIYSDVGDQTCQHRPGSRGHEYQDALQYAKWGVDYLKYDWCGAGTLDPASAYETMARALQATGRPIVFSICEWGKNRPWLWAAASGGNLWRTTQDIFDGWEGRKGISLSVLEILDAQVGLEGYAGPGHWNDPDMLEVGNGGMTDDQYRAHFSLWAILAAPLMAGNDLTTMSDAVREILTNREVIAVDQDRLGVEGHRAAKDGDTEVWVRPLEGGARAVALLNRGHEPAHAQLEWSMLQLPGYLRLHVRDLWRHESLADATSHLAFELPPTSAVMLRLVPVRQR